MKYKGNYTDAYGRSTEPDRKPEKKQRLRKRSYEKHFDGYTVETVLGPDGKAVSVRIYTGALYRQELTTIQRAPAQNAIRLLPVRSTASCPGRPLPCRRQAIIMC